MAKKATDRVTLVNEESDESTTDTVVVDRQELEDLRRRIHQTDQLIKEVSGRAQSEEEIQTRAGKMVARFKNQRHGGKDRVHRYLVWDSTVLDDDEAEKHGKVFHSNVPFSKSTKDVLEDYNRVMGRKTVGGGKDPVQNQTIATSVTDTR